MYINKNEIKKNFYRDMTRGVKISARRIIVYRIYQSILWCVTLFGSFVFIRNSFIDI